ncbi:hypothetical protein JTB14_005339 [Gonioctena quinquepunctata]|nr:hypothetical protein JTB14_005339 [Gonioctena quinquepunctata]
METNEVLEAIEKVTGSSEGKSIIVKLTLGTNGSRGQLAMVAAQNEKPEGAASRKGLICLDTKPLPSGVAGHWESSAVRYSHRIINRNIFLKQKGTGYAESEHKS